MEVRGGDDHAISAAGREIHQPALEVGLHAGGPLEELKQRDPVKLVVSAARGKIDNDYALQIVGTNHWRAFFDIAVEGPEPVDIRAYLHLGDKTLTETWLFQYIQFAW